MPDFGVPHTGGEGINLSGSCTQHGKTHAMKPTIVCGILAILILPFPVSASLGGDATSVHADRVKMEGTLRTSSGDSYTLHEIQTPTGVVAKEYVSPAGKVFAVTWTGPFHPDLRQLLGAYYDEYTQAVQAQRAQRRGRGPISIEHPGLVIEVSGHLRSFVGRAYVPQQLPASMRAEDIR
jgi:Protein of unknown function (DUF2844)